VVARARTRRAKVTPQRLSAWQRGTNLPSSWETVEALVSALVEYSDGQGKFSTIPAELRDLARWQRIWRAAGKPCELEACTPATESSARKGQNDEDSYDLRHGSVDRVCLADAARMHQNDALLDLLDDTATGDDRSLIGCQVAMRASLYE